MTVHARRNDMVQNGLQISGCEATHTITVFETIWSQPPDDNQSSFVGGAIPLEVQVEPYMITQLPSGADFTCEFDTQGLGDPDVAPGIEEEPQLFALYPAVVGVGEHTMEATVTYTEPGYAPASHMATRDVEGVCPRLGAEIQYDTGAVLITMPRNYETPAGTPVTLYADLGDGSDDVTFTAEAEPGTPLQPACRVDTLPDGWGQGDPDGSNPLAVIPSTPGTLIGAAYSSNTSSCTPERLLKACLVDSEVTQYSISGADIPVTRLPAGEETWPSMTEFRLYGEGHWTQWAEFEGNDLMWSDIENLAQAVLEDPWLFGDLEIRLTRNANSVDTPATIQHTWPVTVYGILFESPAPDAQIEIGTLVEWTARIVPAGLVSGGAAIDWRFQCTVGETEPMEGEGVEGTDPQRRVFESVLLTDDDTVEMTVRALVYDPLQGSGWQGMDLNQVIASGLGLEDAVEVESDTPPITVHVSHPSLSEPVEQGSDEVPPGEPWRVYLPYTDDVIFSLIVTGGPQAGWAMFNDWEIPPEWSEVSPEPYFDQLNIQASCPGIMTATAVTRLSGNRDFEEFEIEVILVGLDGPDFAAWNQDIEVQPLPENIVWATEWQYGLNGDAPSINFTGPTFSVLGSRANDDFSVVIRAIRPTSSDSTPVEITLDHSVTLYDTLITPTGVATYESPEGTVLYLPLCEQMQIEGCFISGGLPPTGTVIDLPDIFDVDWSFSISDGEELADFVDNPLEVFEDIETPTFSTTSVAEGEGAVEITTTVTDPDWDPDWIDVSSILIASSCCQPGFTPSPTFISAPYEDGGLTALLTVHNDGVFLQPWILDVWVDESGESYVSMSETHGHLSLRGYQRSDSDYCIDDTTGEPGVVYDNSSTIEFSWSISSEGYSFDDPGDTDVVVLPSSFDSGSVQLVVDDSKFFECAGYRNIDDPEAENVLHFQTLRQRNAAFEKMLSWDYGGFGHARASSVCLLTVNYYELPGGRISISGASVVVCERLYFGSGQAPTYSAEIMLDIGDTQELYLPMSQIYPRGTPLYDERNRYFRADLNPQNYIAEANEGVVVRAVVERVGGHQEVEGSVTGGRPMRSDNVIEGRLR